jgi:RNA polymerase sigma factor (sigma-70 family)
MRSDAELLVAARTEPRAFRELYERHASAVYGFHLGRSRDREAAHDLTAETFAQAWLSRTRFRDEADGSVRPWLFAIARNVLVTSVRRKALERSASERLALVEERHREGSAAEPDQTWLEGLEDAFADLPANQQDAIRLRIVDELPYAEAAAALGTSTTAVRVRVHRGLTSLRNRFSDRPEASR